MWMNGERWINGEGLLNHHCPPRIPLLRPYFLRCGIDGAPLDSHDTFDGSRIRPEPVEVYYVAFSFKIPGAYF